MPWDPPTTQAEADAIVAECEQLAADFRSPEVEVTKAALCAKLCEAKGLLCPNYPAQCEQIEAMILEFECACGE